MTFPNFHDDDPTLQEAGRTLDKTAPAGLLRNDGPVVTYSLYFRVGVTLPPFGGCRVLALFLGAEPFVLNYAPRDILPEATLSPDERSMFQRLSDSWSLRRHYRTELV